MNGNYLSNNGKANVPEWAKKVVWYQIYPERFENGDTTNDPQLKDQTGSWPHDQSKPWEVHPWQTDWYALQTWEQNHLNLWDNIQRRRYGGDLQGIIDRLDYLKDLGIGAIYLNPVFESPSHHKYDAATYHHIDPNFGPDPEGDRKLIATEIPNDSRTWNWTSADKLFLFLIQEVHKRDMRIIIDGVFNHVGLNHWAFVDLKEKQRDSQFGPWFKVRSYENQQNNTPFRVSTWEGFMELPEWRQDKNGIVKGPREYIYEITRRWMDPQGNGNTKAGIDGWRLDVAFCVKHNFWKNWRKLVKSINPQAYLTGEVIGDLSVQQEHLQGDEFDAIMNYEFAFNLTEWIGSSRPVAVSKFISNMKQHWNAFDPEINSVMQNLLDSHDTARVLSQIHNRDLSLKFRNWWNFFEKSRGSNPDYKTYKPDKQSFRLLRLMTLVQFTWPGAPMVYYGDEAGMWGANDPCCRKPMVWPDKTYEDETLLPDGTQLSSPNSVAFDDELYQWYRGLIHLRNQHSALQTGTLRFHHENDDDHTLIYSREHSDQICYILINNGLYSITLDLPEANSGQQLFPKVSSQQESKFHLAPHSGIIVLKA